MGVHEGNGFDLEVRRLSLEDVSQLTRTVMSILVGWSTNMFRAVLTKRLLLQIKDEGAWEETLSREKRSSSGELLEQFLSSQVQDKVDQDYIQELHHGLLKTVQVAKGHKSHDIKAATKGKTSSVLEAPEFLYTEEMIKEIIWFVLLNSPGPFDMGTSILALNTFEGYDYSRDYEAQPPSTKEEWELIKGMDDIEQRFTFNSQTSLTKERYIQYMRDCEHFFILIFNYVVRELELCEIVKPLGTIERGEHLVKLYLIDPESVINEKGHLLMEDTVLPYRLAFSWKNQLILSLELIDYIFETEAMEVYMDVAVYIRDPEGDIVYQDEQYKRSAASYLVFSFSDALEMLAINSGVGINKVCDYLISALKEITDAKDDADWVQQYETLVKGSQCEQISMK